MEYSDSTKGSVSESILAQLPQRVAGFEQRKTDKTPRYFTTGQQSVRYNTTVVVENEAGEPEEFDAQISFCVNLYPHQAKGKAVSLNTISRDLKASKIDKAKAAELAQAWAANL
jgi:hypothetical protein